MNEIKRIIRLNADPEKVYSLISQPEHLSSWFCDEATRTNQQLSFKWKNDDGTVSGFNVEIVQHDAPTTFVYRSLANDMLVTRFDVHGEGETTQLALHETGFAEDDAGRELWNTHNSGWDWFLSRLQKLDN